MGKTIEQIQNGFNERQKKYDKLDLEFNAALAVNDLEAIKRIIAEILNVYETR